MVESTRGGKDELEVESFAFADNPLLTFFPFAPQRRMDFVLREMRLNDGVVTQRFSGQVRKVEAQGKILRARVATQLDAEDRLLPRLMIGKTCSYRLGDPGCGFDLTALVVQGTVTDAGGYNVVLPEINGRPDNWFAGGACSLIGGDQIRQVRQVLFSSGTTLVVSAPFAGNPIGLTLRVSPGCDKRPATCAAKFNNFANFGGHPLIDQNLVLKGVKVKQRQQAGKK
jgi:uncharacterized phage protein (TIGR02218 family)